MGICPDARVAVRGTESLVAAQALVDEPAGSASDASVGGVVRRPERRARREPFGRDL